MICNNYCCVVDVVNFSLVVLQSQQDYEGFFVEEKQKV